MEKEGFDFVKRGQVTVFIIVGILIVVAIVLIFIFQNEITSVITGTMNPTKFVQDCVKNDLEFTAENVISSGGVYYAGSNKEEFYVRNGTNYAILCTTNISRTSCVNQHPLLLDEAQQTIRQTIISKVNGCFSQLQKKYPNLQISKGDLQFDVRLNEDVINVEINKQVSVVSDEESTLFSNFNFEVNSKVYNFLDLANVVVNSESSCNCVQSSFTSSSGPSVIYMAANGTTNPFLSSKTGCDVDLSKLNQQYKGYTFTRESVGTGEKLYTITSLSEPIQNFSFYVRNCFSACDGPEGVCYHHYHVGDTIHYSSIADSCHNQIHHYHNTEEYVVD